MFRHHGIPPSASSTSRYLLGYACFNAVDTLLLMSFTFHVFRPLSNFQQYGITFLLFFPAITILSPFVGILACVTGSPRLIQIQSSFNATAVLANYPLTLLLQIDFGDGAIYIAILVLLWFNKILLSYFGAKVRLHLLNPAYNKNLKKIEGRFRNMVQTKADMKSGI